MKIENCVRENNGNYDFPQSDSRFQRPQRGEARQRIAWGAVCTGRQCNCIDSAVDTKRRSWFARTVANTAMHRTSLACPLPLIRAPLHISKYGGRTFMERWNNASIVHDARNDPLGS